MLTTSFSIKSKTITNRTQNVIIAEYTISAISFPVTPTYSNAILLLHAFILAFVLTTVTAVYFYRASLTTPFFILLYSP